MAGANQLLSPSYIWDPVFSKTLRFSCSSVSLLHKLLIPANWAIAAASFFFHKNTLFLLATAFSRWSTARKKYALKWVWKTENFRMASPDARLYVDLAATLTTEFVCPQCAITLLQMFVFFSTFFFPFGVIFALMSFFTSNAPKLFCGCRQPNTLWCLCTRKRPNLFVCNVHKCCSVRNLY